MSEHLHSAAVRLAECIDEILALVRSWPGRAFAPGDAFTDRVKTKSAPVRDFTEDDLVKFDELDAKIGGLMTWLGLSPPAHCVTQSNHLLSRGYTELLLLTLRQ